MHLIRDIVKEINCKLEKVFAGGFIAYGVAQNLPRGEDLLPTINEKYVGLDDIHAMSLYHKINSIGITQRAGTYGDDEGFNVNTYQMSMIVFNNQKRTNMNADELALLIQTAFPKRINSEVKNLMTGVILNSQTVYGQEYKSNTYRLGELQSLFQINYQTEVLFRTDCLDLCPEDFKQINS